MQEFALAVLHFEDGRERERARVFQAQCACVAAGRMDPRRAWPEYFSTGGDQDAFPSRGADMSGFTWEQPTPESAMADIDTMMHGMRVSVRDTHGPPSAPPDLMQLPAEPPVSLRPGRPQPQDASSLEWG